MFAAESTVGTDKGTLTHTQALLPGSSFENNIQRVASPELYTGTNSRTRRGFAVASNTSTGRLSFHPKYENMGLIWKHALGALSTTGAGPYVHSYTLAEQDGLGLTMELVRGSAAQADTFIGTKIQRLRLSGRATAPFVQLDLDLVAMTMTQAAKGTPSLGSGQTPILMTQSSKVTFDGASYDFSSFEVTLANGLDYPHRIQGADTSAEPPAGWAVITARFEMDYTDEVQITDLIAGAQSDLVFTFTSGSLIAEITIQNGYLTGDAGRSLADGPQSATLNYVGESDGTDLGMKIKITNADSTGTAN